MTTRSRARKARHLAFLVAANIASLAVAQSTVTWLGVSGLGTGNWSVGSNWTGSVVPNNGVPMGSSYNVIIDAQPGFNSTASLNITVAINVLTIDAGDQVAQANSTTLTIAGNAGVSTINNAGTYTLSGIATPATVTGGANDLRLTGGGTFVIGTVSRFSGSGTWTNVDNFIRGGGNIGVNDLAIINNSIISADANIRIDPGAATGMTNNSILEANGGTLELSGNGGGGFTNLGTIRALDASTVSLIQTARVSGGTFATSGSGVVQIQAGDDGTLSTVTNLGNFALQNASNTFLLGTITNSGSMSINGSSTTDLEILGAVTLNGGGVLNLNNPLSRVLNSGTLTNNSTISGQGNLGLNSVTLLNNGLVRAIGGTLTVDPANNGTLAGVINTGTMRAAGGGTLALSGNGFGFFDNSTGNIIADDGGVVNLATSVTMNGGTYTTTGSGLIQVPAGNDATLSSATVNGNMASQNASNTFITNVLTNNGIWNVNGGSTTDVEIVGSVAFNGTGVVNLNNPAARVHNNGTLTNNITINGQGQLGLNSLGMVNNGTISAVGGTLLIDPLNGGASAGFVNTGTLRAASGATLTLSGNGFGFFDNTTGDIVAESGAIVNISTSATIIGGTLSAVGSGLFQVPANNDATFTSVTVNGPLASQNATNTFITGSFVNNGTWDVNGVSTTDVEIIGPVTLSGTGALNLNNPATRLLNSGTLTSSIPIRGQGNIGVNALTVVNNNLIEASGGLLTIDPPNNSANPGLTNNATLRAAGVSTLTLSGSGFGFFDNANGTIAALNDGTVILTDSVLINGGTLSTSGTGLIQVAAANNATLSSVTVNGSLASQNATNTFIVNSLVNNGIWDVNGASSTDIEIVGAVSLSGSGVLNLNNAATNLHNSGTLTNGILIRGRGGIGQNALTTINNGTIEAVGGTLLLDPGNNSTLPGMINNGTLRATSGATLTLSGNGFGFIASPGPINVDGGGTLVILSGGIVNADLVTLDGQWNHNNGTATIRAVRGAGTLAIATGTTNRVIIAAGGGTAGTSKIGALNVTGIGRIDLNDHDLILDYTGISPFGTIRPLLQSGFNSGSWNGSGMTSSTAAAAAPTPDKTGLGYVEATDIFTSFPATFRGQSVDATSVLIGYTLAGDANLDRVVNISDFSRLAANFNTPSNWFNGDFNYSGTTEIGDFALLAANFNKTLAADLPRLGALESLQRASVPEPESVILLGFAAALKCHRRRRGV